MLSRRRQMTRESSQSLGDGWQVDIHVPAETAVGGTQVLPRKRLYDQIDGSYMEVEPHNLRHYETKYVAYCSVCRRPATADTKGQRLVQSHIRQQHEVSLSHQHAEAMPLVSPDGQGNRCTGCGVAFISRPNDVYKHIAMAKECGPQHRNAKVLVMKRFSLEPPVLEQPEATLVVTEEPTQVAPDDRRKSRRRRRHRGRRKGSAA